MNNNSNQNCLRCIFIEWMSAIELRTGRYKFAYWSVLTMTTIDVVRHTHTYKWYNWFWYENNSNAFWVFGFDSLWESTIPCLGCFSRSFFYGRVSQSTHTHTQTHSVVCIFDMTMISRFNRIFTFIAGHENFFVHIFYVSISDGIVKKKWER